MRTSGLCRTPHVGALGTLWRPFSIAEGFQQLFESGRHYGAFVAQHHPEPVTDFHNDFLAVPMIEIDRRHSPTEHPVMTAWRI
jgi:hypothetical protein